MSPVTVGAVLYDPRVSVIWEIIREFFDAEGCPIDPVFFADYDRQVAALLDGGIDVAWNSPLAWLDAQRRTGGRCRALAMRDTDRDRVTHLVVRRGEGLHTLAGLRGSTVACGASDSPQATLLPLQLLRRHGLRLGEDFTLRRFDLLVGLHGDHVGGEEAALRSLQRGETDAAAVLDLNWERWVADGTADPRQLTVLASTPPFDHCNFTVRDEFPAERAAAWCEVLFRMRYDDPAHREMMDLEGLKAWLPGRTDGYADLEAAVRDQGWFEARR